MTTIEFAKENREQVIENCPQGVELGRFMNEFIVKFNKISAEYGFVGFPSFYDAINETVETIRTDAQIAGIKANNFLQDHNAEVAKQMMNKR